MQLNIRLTGDRQNGYRAYYLEPEKYYIERENASVYDSIPFGVGRTATEALFGLARGTDYADLKRWGIWDKPDGLRL